MRTACVLIGLLACNKDDDGNITRDTDTGTPPEDTDTTPPPPPGPDLYVVDDNDYTLTTEWTIATTPIFEQFDVTISWNALTVDAWGEPFPVLDTDKLVLMQILAEPDEIPEHIAMDDLEQDVTLLGMWEADSDGEAFLSLSDLRPAGDPTGNPFDPDDFMFENDSISWLAALTVMNGEQYDILQALIIVPQAVEGSAQAQFADASSSTTWSAAIDGVPLLTAEGWESYYLNWQGLVNDAFGREYDETRINYMFLASFDEEPPALASGILDLQDMATGWWTMDIANEDQGLPEIARDDEGDLFQGFTVGPTWIVGTYCTTADCFTRFPAWLVEVDVVAQ